MSLYADFETNKQKEIEGVPVYYSANRDKSIPTFYVTRMSRSNQRYAKKLDAATKPIRRQIELETVKPETAEKISMEVFVDTILKGWENIQDREGKVIEFNKKNAISLFTDLPDLYDDLEQKAKKASTFRDAEMEEEAKN